MTLDDLAKWPKRTVGTEITAHFLEMDRWNVTLAARQKILPVESYFSGNRLHVKRDSILAYFGYIPKEAVHGAAD
jgi:hypothetical protein